MKALEAKLEAEVHAALDEENEGGNAKRAEMSTPVGKLTPTPRPPNKRHCPDDALKPASVAHCPAPEASQLAQCEDRLLGNDDVLMLALQSQFGTGAGMPSPGKASPNMSPMKTGMSPLCPRRLNETPSKEAAASSDQFAATQVVHTPLAKQNKATVATPATIMEDTPSPHIAAADDPYSSSSMPEAHVLSSFVNFSPSSIHTTLAQPCTAQCLNL